MPKTASNTNSAKNEVAENEVKQSVVDTEQILKDNAELKQKLEMLMETLQNQKPTNLKEEKVEKLTISVDKKEYPEPSPNKRIRIMSLDYGQLNLSTEYGGKSKLEFDKYGQIKSVLYSALTDIVNANSKFIEQGKVYILDKDAVFNLGLTDIYSQILPKDIIDKICNYSPVDISGILDNVTDSQKETIIHNIVMNIYNGEQIDYNKVDLINKKFGVDINSKVEEMKNFDLASK